MLGANHWADIYLCQKKKDEELVAVAIKKASSASYAPFGPSYYGRNIRTICELRFSVSSTLFRKFGVNTGLAYTTAGNLQGRYVPMEGFDQHHYNVTRPW